MAAISEMNRALGSAAEKFEYLRGFIQDKKLEGRAIIFCGDGSTELESQSTTLTESESRDRDRVRDILVSEGVICNNFTAEESSARRKEILKAFEEGDTKCLISIRVLDEGIDVPGVETAVILASSRNRRQFVQRRGRVLRKAEGKTLAKIYDFICLPPPGILESGIVDGELKRLVEMSDVCENIDLSKELIRDLASKYKLKEDTQELIKDLI
jgi:superfamily II DNA or RNA helicase